MVLALGLRPCQHIVAVVLLVGDDHAVAADVHYDRPVSRALDYAFRRSEALHERTLRIEDVDFHARGFALCVRVVIQPPFDRDVREVVRKRDLLEQGIVVDALCEQPHLGCVHGRCESLVASSAYPVRLPFLRRQGLSLEADAADEVAVRTVADSYIAPCSAFGGAQYVVQLIEPFALYLVAEGAVGEGPAVHAVRRGAVYAVGLRFSPFRSSWPALEPVDVHAVEGVGRKREGVYDVYRVHTPREGPELLPRGYERRGYAARVGLGVGADA